MCVYIYMQLIVNNLNKNLQEAWDDGPITLLQKKRQYVKIANYK
jgi:hypothetical protein